LVRSVGIAWSAVVAVVTGTDAARTGASVAGGAVTGTVVDGGSVVDVVVELDDDGLVVKGLSGLLTLMHDNGYDDRECIAWLFTDADLPGRPIDALRENRGSEVKRRAQAMGF